MSQELHDKIHSFFDGKKTYIAIAIGILAKLTGLWGIEIAESDVMTAIALGVALVADCAAIYGRAVATK